MLAQKIVHLSYSVDVYTVRCGRRISANFHRNESQVRFNSAECRQCFRWRTRHFEAGERWKRMRPEFQVHMCESSFINMCTWESMDWQLHKSVWKLSWELVKGCKVCNGSQFSSALFQAHADSFLKGMAMSGLGNPLGFKEPVGDRPVPTICNHMGACWKAESKIFKRVSFDQWSTHFTLASANRQCVETKEFFMEEKLTRKSRCNVVGRFGSSFRAALQSDQP